MTIYSSITEIIDYVTTSLGNYASDYDTEAIAQEISEWRHEFDADGNVWLGQSGLVIKAEYAEDETGTSDAYWAVVEANVKADR